MSESVFGAPIYRYYLDPTKIKKFAEEKFSKNKDLPLDGTPPGWGCKLRTEFESSHLNRYKDYYDDIMHKFTVDVGVSNCKCNIYETWLNYYEGPGHFQEEHDHLPGFYSGIHYIKFDPEVHSQTQFVNPLHQMYTFMNGDIEFEDHDDSTKQFWAPDTKEGDIIIFPSFLRHMVPVSHHTDARITLAFNINTINGSTRRVFRK